MSREKIKAKVRKFVGGPELHIHDVGRFVDGIVDMVLDDVLSDATVERAARALAEETFGPLSDRWESMDAESHDFLRNTARAVLAAAVKEER